MTGIGWAEQLGAQLGQTALEPPEWERWRQQGRKIWRRSAVRDAQSAAKGGMRGAKTRSAQFKAKREAKKL